MQFIIDQHTLTSYSISQLREGNIVLRCVRCNESIGDWRSEQEISLNNLFLRVFEHQHFLG